MTEEASTAVVTEEEKGFDFQAIFDKILKAIKAIGDAIIKFMQAFNFKT